MSFQNFKTNSYSVGQKHYSGTKNVVGEISFIKKKLVERLNYYLVNVHYATEKT